MALDEPKDTDKVFKHDNVDYLIDQELLQQVEEVQIDFVDQGYVSGFSVKAKKPIDEGPSSCGPSCGSDCAV